MPDRPIRRIFLLLLSTIAAIVLLPIATNFSPETTTYLPDEVLSPIGTILQDHATSVAIRYQTPPPLIRVVDASIPAMTITVPDNSESKRHVEIRLGTPLHKADFLAAPDIMRAIVGHETGHAVMMARGETALNYTVLVMYGLAVLPLLIIMPTARGLLLLAMSIGTVIVALQRLGITNPHEAFAASLTIMAIITALCAWKYNFAKWPGGLAKHVPAARRLALVSVATLPYFFVLTLIFGSLNATLEHRADVFGACSTSPATMQEALQRVSPSPSRIKETLDAFHPSLHVRIEILEALKSPYLLDKACKAIENRTPLRIAGQRII